jgi:hypothetical protein
MLRAAEPPTKPSQTRRGDYKVAVIGILKRDFTFESSMPMLHSEVKVLKSSEPNPVSELDSMRVPLFEMLTVI